MTRTQKLQRLITIYSENAITTECEFDRRYWLGMLGEAVKLLNTEIEKGQV